MITTILIILFFVVLLLKPVYTVLTVYHEELDAIRYHGVITPLALALYFKIIHPSAVRFLTRTEFEKFYNSAEEKF